MNRLGGKPLVQLLRRGNLESCGGADAVVGLGDDREADLPDEGADGLFSLASLDLPGGRDAAEGIVFFHLRLLLDAGDMVGMETRRNVEVRTQAGILLEPVLVVGLDPVDLSELEGEPGDGTEHLVVILEVAHLVITREAVAELRGEIFKVGIGDG